MIPTVVSATGKSSLSVILALLCCFLVLVKKRWSFGGGISDFIVAHALMHKRWKWNAMKWDMRDMYTNGSFPQCINYRE